MSGCHTIVSSIPSENDAYHVTIDALHSGFQPHHFIGVAPACIAHASTRIVVRAECVCVATGGAVVLTQRVVVGVIGGRVECPGLNLAQRRRAQALYDATSFDGASASFAPGLFFARAHTGTQVLINGRLGF